MKIMKLLSLFAGAIFALTLTSCKDSDSNSNNDYAVAEAQLKLDYATYNIGNIKWSEERGYQIGEFSAVTKSQTPSITAWYTVNDKTAIRQMDSKDLGTTVPAIIKPAFEATKYSNTQLWRVDEIELDHNYNNNGIESYYEMELQNLQNANLEAELFFNSTTGELLYSKEELDNDNDNDTFVINDQLKAAVEAAVPGAVIIDAEIDDNFIEVDAIITSNGVAKEIELKFTINYALVSSEIETDYTYSTLPSEFDVINAWFESNPTTPIPAPITKVEVTEGNQTEDDYQIGTYYYEIEIDDYINGGVEYEVEFYLSETYQIIAVIVDDKKQ